MLVFDAFPDLFTARVVALLIRADFLRRTTLLYTADEINFVDAVPYQVVPPVLLVERGPDRATEDAVIQLVVECGGHFAGT